MLLQQFVAYVQEHGLFHQGQRLYLAISGGVDSVVLASLCKQAGYPVHLLHVNFGLRGAESDRDQQFVETLTMEWKMPLEIRRLDAAAYAEAQGCSIQVAARELRYDWFAQLVNAAGGAATSRLLTAHHLDDSLETSLMNFFKGTGIAGLRGIRPLHQHIARPLLFASREVIMDYATQEQLRWVHDSSNDSDKYTRNFFRNQLIPLVKEVYPSVEDNMLANQDRFRDVDEVYQQAIARYRSMLLHVRGGELQIPVRRLRQLSPVRTILWELVQPYGFSPDQLPDLLRLLDAENSRFVTSASHRLIRNREWLVLAPVQVTDDARVLLEGSGSYPFTAGTLTLSTEDASFISSDPLVALLDARDLRFPLTVRAWKAGDYFYPLGMSKKKKVARFLIDGKLSRTQKEQVRVIEDAGQRIVWIIGQRIDDRFKVRPSSGAAWRIQWHQ